MTDMPTADDYRLALEKCVAEKAAGWSAACKAAELASKEINRLRLTDEEREAIESVATLAGLEAAAWYNEENEEEKKFWRDRKNTLRSLLDRLKVRY